MLLRRRPLTLGLMTVSGGGTLQYQCSYSYVDLLKTLHTYTAPTVVCETPHTLCKGSWAGSA